jgi:hypothetical protein
MLGLIASIGAFFKALASLVSFIGAGAAAYALGRIVEKFFGVVGGLATGAAVVAAMAFWVWSSDDTNQKQYIAQLEQKQNELRLTNEALRHTLGELSKAAEHNEGVMQQLREKLSNVPDRPECVIDKDIVDELQRIR